MKPYLTFLCWHTTNKILNTEYQIELQFLLSTKLMPMISSVFYSYTYTKILYFI